jgi:phosphate:Na+ symporter
VLTTLKSNVQTRQVPLGNLVFKIVGVLIMMPLVGLWLHAMCARVPRCSQLVVLFHLAFNTVVGLACIGLTGTVARLVQRLLPHEEAPTAGARPQHLDPSALATPSLAISVRRARGAAPGRRGRDRCCGHAPGDPHRRPQAGPGPAQTR